jgi:hypothetical protein
MFFFQGFGTKGCHGIRPRYRSLRLLSLATLATFATLVNTPLSGPSCRHGTPQAPPPIRGKNPFMRLSRFLCSLLFAI